MSLRERIAFLRQFRADFHHPGAIQPSSRWLARAMTRPLRRAPPGPRHIVEIGPGTGAVTRAIARAMETHDRLDCYEINADFCRFLEALLDTAPDLATVREQVTIRNAPAQELAATPTVDFVVCSAPLNNFDAGTIDAIFDAAFDALVPGGTFTFFEYAWLPAWKRALSRGRRRERLDQARQAKEGRLAAHPHTDELVLRNLPPARAHHLRRDTSQGAEGPCRESDS